MAREIQKQKSKDAKLSPRMEQFIDSVIEEVEEAGIDDEYADKEPKPTSARVAQPTVYARRTRRQQSL
jgi:hypothetical protein